jgi:hypothetical protein
MRIVLIFLSILNIAIIVNANPKRSLGLKIGPYISTIRYFEKSDNNGSSTHSFEPKSNLTTSFFLDLPQNNTIVHSFLLNYYQSSGEESNYLSSQSISLRYIGLAYNFKAIVNVQRFTPYFACGVSFDILTDYDIVNTFLVNLYRVYNDDDIDHFTARAIICLGTEYNLDKISLLLEYGFSYNLIPFLTWKNHDESFRYNYTCYGHSINFGIKVPF